LWANYTTFNLAYNISTKLYFASWAAQNTIKNTINDTVTVNEKLCMSISVLQ